MDTQIKGSLLERGNDLRARDLPSRLSRFLRARLRRWASAGMMLADDPRVLQAWTRGWDPVHFIQLHRWRREGFQPKIVYDIGAHQGLWSEMCQEIFSPAKCLLFEPQKEFQTKAQARRPKAGADWEIVPVALGDREEDNLLHVTQNAAASSLLKPLESAGASLAETRAVGENRVQVMPLDLLASKRGLPPPDLVKIDVQGFEGRVLAGGPNTLRQAKRMVVEVSLQPLYDAQSLMPEVLRTLGDWGFELDDLSETMRQWPGQLWQVDLWLKRSGQAETWENPKAK